MSSITRTPAHAAQLGAAVDRPAPRLNSRQALGVILAVYALFFAGSDVYAILNPPGGQIEDYANKQGIVILADAAAEITAAFAIRYLICRWLAIPRALAGIPRARPSTLARGQRRRVIPSMQPAWLVTGAAIGGALLAIGVNLLTTPRGRRRRQHDQPHRRRQPPLPARCGLRSINAGIVEEITIVALPVLLGRRAGWHPTVIIAISVLMRWPYHLYHGGWPTIPWTIAWATPHVLAYLYLRRLWPLVIVHTCQDLLAFNAPMTLPTPQQESAFSCYWQSAGCGAGSAHSSAAAPSPTAPAHPSPTPGSTAAPSPSRTRPTGPTCGPP